MHYVLDACALLAFLRGEEGADKIETLLLDNNNRCSAHAVNLCEFYFNLVREYGETTARAAMQNSRILGFFRSTICQNHSGRMPEISRP